MKKLIIKKIANIEKELNVKVILCVESGSRVWGMSSKNSDYDVRFVYVRPIKDYISINSLSDVVVRHYDKNGNSQEAKGCYLDFCGFDIFKFMKMLSSSNPTVIEWLKSDRIYLEKDKQSIDRLRDWSNTSFKHISLYHHYRSMCRQNYLKYLKTGKLVTYKKYLYAMRGLVNAKWVEENKSLPPVNFIETIERSQSFLPQWLVSNLFKIIELKSCGLEQDIIQNEVKVDNYIESFLKDNNIKIENTHATIHELDSILKKIVMEPDAERLLTEILPEPTRKDLMLQLNLLLRENYNWGRINILDLKRLVECVRKIK